MSVYESPTALYVVAIYYVFVYCLSVTLPKVVSARFGSSFNNFPHTFVWQNWFFLAVLLSSVAAQARLEQNSKKESILPNKCVRKVVEALNKSQYFQFSDKNFWKTTDVLSICHICTCIMSVMLVILPPPPPHIVTRFAKSAICKIRVVLQQLFSHICLAKLILSCCFAPFGRRASAARAKQQERINFAEQMCEKSCWRTEQNSVFPICR